MLTTAALITVIALLCILLAYVYMAHLIATHKLRHLCTQQTALIEEYAKLISLYKQQLYKSHDQARAHANVMGSMVAQTVLRKARTHVNN